MKLELFSMQFIIAYLYLSYIVNPETLHAYQKQWSSVFNDIETGQVSISTIKF